MKIVTAVSRLSVSMAPDVSSTELSEKEEDGKWEHRISCSPSLSMSVVSKLNLNSHTNKYFKLYRNKNRNKGDCNGLKTGRVWRSEMNLDCKN